MIIDISTLQSCLHGTVPLSVIVLVFFLDMARFISEEFLLRTTLMMSLFDFDILILIARIKFGRNSDADEIASLHAFCSNLLQTLVPPEAVFLHLAVSLEGGT